MAELREAADLVSAVLFIVGVMRLRHPASARSGNLIAAAGMALALAFSVGAGAGHLALAAGTAVVGAALGVAVARKVRITAMPQMVALFNGMGGGAAALVALAEVAAAGRGPGLPAAASAPAAFTLAIGSVSLAGSMIAFAKLQEWIGGRPLTYRGQRAGNATLAVLVLLLAAALVLSPARQAPVVGVVLAATAAILGVAGVLPIGGADMPVVISLLNSLTGLAAAATGFVLQSPLLIVAGALVGASGTILTQLMSRAMHRSLGNVLFGAFGRVASGARASGAAAAEQPVHEATVDDVVTLLAYARRVVIVPGYGLAVARAQQEIRDLYDALRARGADVRFAIHPVAGRMPGHMNVLLAEADVPYDRMYEPDAINKEFPSTDVALVVGANDVTNPAARTDAGSPIYGMPILDVDRAQSVIVLKRSMAPGFAGVDNPLYHMDRTLILFGDARRSLSTILSALHEQAA